MSEKYNRVLQMNRVTVSHIEYFFEPIITLVLINWSRIYYFFELVFRPKILDPYRSTKKQRLI